MISVAQVALHILFDDYLFFTFLFLAGCGFGALIVLSIRAAKKFGRRKWNTIKNVTLTE